VIALAILLAVFAPPAWLVVQLFLHRPPGEPGLNAAPCHSRDPKHEWVNNANI